MVFWTEAQKKRYLAKRYANIERIYGLSPKDYDALFEKQDGRCAICRKVLELGKQFCVDHDHETKEVRGLLCGFCNRGIGHFDIFVLSLCVKLRHA